MIEVNILSALGANADGSHKLLLQGVFASAIVAFTGFFLRTLPRLPNS
jgi:hypothetical protein